MTVQLTMNSLFWPMFFLFAVTAAVAISMGFRRMGAIRRREVDFRYYRVYQGTGEPEPLAAHTRHLTNLFEAPVLFYVAILTALALNVQSVVMLWLAWGYAGLRALHTAIHMGSNVVIHRFRVFGLSWVVLLALWLVLAYHLLPP